MDGRGTSKPGVQARCERPQVKKGGSTAAAIVHTLGDQEEPAKRTLLCERDDPLCKVGER